MNYIVFDTETTGLPNVKGSPIASQPHIIELAAIKLNDKLEEIGRIDFLCNPGIPLSDIIIKITKLHDSDLQDKPPFSAKMTELCEFFLGAEALIAHNAKFDVSLLEFELERLDRRNSFPWPYRHICTIEKSMYIKGYRLSLAKLYKIATGLDHLNNAHRAMADVEVLVDCVRWLRKEGAL